MEQTLRGKLTYRVTLMVASTLCLVVCGMVFTLMMGLFDEKVDNSEIFKLISPAFQTICGGFMVCWQALSCPMMMKKAPSREPV